MTNREVIESKYGFWVVYPLENEDFPNGYAVVVSQDHEAGIATYSPYVALGSLAEVEEWLNREAVEEVGTEDQQ